MAVITVPSGGREVSGVTLDDILQAGSDVDPTSTTNFEIDGASILRSLYIGTAVEVDIGGFLATGSSSLTGTGNITGDNNPNATLPALVNYGVLDVNGAIDVMVENNSQIVVSAGERLDLEGNELDFGAATMTVAPTAELDINSQSSALIDGLASQGTLKVTAPTVSRSGATTLAGTVTVQGDAPNAVGSGVAAPRGIGNTYVATLDLRSATLSAPINSLTLLQDAQVRFGNGPSTVDRFVLAGSAAAMVPLDVVYFDGPVTISGDGSGAANQVTVAQAEFMAGNPASGGTIDFAVATGGGASLQQQIVVDAGTTLRNDGQMTIGSQGTAPATIGATAAAANSTLVNGAAGQLTIEAGAALSVAAIQNAGAVTVAGDATFLQALLNTGTVDVKSGTLSLQASVQGAGTIVVETGATLNVNGASSQANVALGNGSTLRLSQPATFASTIQAPSAGATIDLAGTAATAATVANGSIAVTTPSGTINLAETGLINGTTLALSTDGAGGTLLALPASPVVTGPPAPGMTQPAVYRFFDSIHGTHVFTASRSEKQPGQATRADLVYEGIGLNAVDPAADPNAAPVFRFFDTRFGTHFYTSSSTERDNVAATRPDLTFEGVGFYEHTTAQPGDAPVYRFFDSNNGTHFYTQSATERATVIATRPDLVSEGTGFYAPVPSAVS